MISVPFQTILVAIDETEVSNRALTAATTLAKALDARLMIVHVLDPHDVHRGRAPYAPAAATDVVQAEAARLAYEKEWLDYVEYYASMLKQKADEAIAAGIDADFIHPNGSPSLVLCELARTQNISLLVVGSHQRVGMAEIMLGSTSNYIVHHAPCSVLVVYAGDQTDGQTNEQATGQATGQAAEQATGQTDGQTATTAYTHAVA